MGPQTPWTKPWGDSSQLQLFGPTPLSFSLKYHQIAIYVSCLYEKRFLLFYSKNENKMMIYHIFIYLCLGTCMSKQQQRRSIKQDMWEGFWGSIWRNTTCPLEVAWGIRKFKVHERTHKYTTRTHTNSLFFKKIMEEKKERKRERGKKRKIHRTLVKINFNCIETHHGEYEMNFQWNKDDIRGYKY